MGSQQEAIERLDRAFQAGDSGHTDAADGPVPGSPRDERRFVELLENLGLR